jgi:RecJ-like exonuclease
MAAMETLTAPGRGIVRTCRECKGEGRMPSGAECLGCDGAGKRITHACPKCGNVAFDYVNGHSEDAGMIDRLGCGHRWTAEDSAWLVQVLPS